MYTIQRYLAARTMEEAFETLNNNRKNVILGGGNWLALGRKNINTLIDLSQLGLNSIIETEYDISIGACVTLRQLETSLHIKNHWNGILSKCVSPIVGVQLRNTATVGASVYSRFGFSDLITALLSLDTTVELYHNGILPLENFLSMGILKDIILSINVKKDGRTACFQTMRKSATDFPILNVSVSRLKNDWRISIGARPAAAMLARNCMQAMKQGDDIQTAAQLAGGELIFGSNTRACAEYRQLLASELVKRAISSII